MGATDTFTTRAITRHKFTHSIASLIDAFEETLFDTPVSRRKGDKPLIK